MTTQIGMGTGIYPKRTLIRVRAADVQRVEREDSDSDRIGLEACLECWKIYISSDDRYGRAKGMSLPQGAIDADAEGYASDLNDKILKDNMEIGAETNGAINSLEPAHFHAIYRKCSVSTQWKYPSLNYASTVVDAEKELIILLKKRLVTAKQFR